VEVAASTNFEKVAVAFWFPAFFAWANMACASAFDTVPKRNIIGLDSAVAL
jgi:hypothetical protein